MLKKEWQEEKTIKLCKECYNCKIKNNKVHCKKQYFTDIDYDKNFILFTPYDFNCLYYEEVN